MNNFTEVISFEWQGRRFAIHKRSKWIILPNGQILYATNWNDADQENKVVELKLEHTIDMNSPGLDIMMIAQGVQGVVAEEVKDGA